MSSSYSSLDLDSAMFPQPPSPSAEAFVSSHYPSSYANPLPAYQSESPPSYYAPPTVPPAYTFPNSLSSDIKNCIPQDSSIATSFLDTGVDFLTVNASSTAVEHPSRETNRASSRITIAHPYARLYAKKDGSKRRKIWNHVLEKQLFSPQELFVVP